MSRGGVKGKMKYKIFINRLGPKDEVNGTPNGSDRRPSPKIK